MATRVSDSSPAAARLRAAQSTLTRLLVRDLRGLRRLIDPARLQDSLPLWMEAVRALVGQYGAASATLAARSYDGQRDAAKVPGRFDAVPADSPPDEQVAASLRWATKDLWPTDELQESFDARLAQAEQRAQAVAQKLVADQGRATMRESVNRDRGAVAYARAAALGGCSFCKLMASRGMVYRTAESAGREANERFEGDGGEAKFHNWCRCVVIPVYRGQTFELSPHAAEWDRLYKEYAQGHPGEQLRLFRGAFREHQQALGRPA